MLWETDMGMFTCAVGVLLTGIIVWKLVSKFQRDHEVLRHYQRQLFDNAMLLIGDEEVPDSIAKFAYASYRVSTARYSTIWFILFCFIPNRYIASHKSTKQSDEFKEALLGASEDMKEKISKIAFASAIVLEKKSLCLGWLVVPAMLGSVNSGATHPNTFNEIVRPSPLFSMMSNRAAEGC